MGHRLAPRAKADLEELALYIFVETGISRSPTVSLIRYPSGSYFLVGIQEPVVSVMIFDRISGRSPSAIIVFYRIEGDDLLVQRVVHGGRDLGALLRDE